MRMQWGGFRLFSWKYNLSETYPSHFCGPWGKLEFTKLPDKNTASCQITPMGGLAERQSSELFINNGLSNSLHVKGVITDVHHALAHVDCLGQQRHIAWNSLHCHAAFNHEVSVWLPIRGIICNTMASPCLDSQPGTWKGQLISLNVLHGHIILQLLLQPTFVLEAALPLPCSDQYWNSFNYLGQQ